MLQLNPLSEKKVMDVLGAYAQLCSMVTRIKIIPFVSKEGEWDEEGSQMFKDSLENFKKVVPKELWEPIIKLNLEGFDMAVLEKIASFSSKMIKKS